MSSDIATSSAAAPPVPAPADRTGEIAGGRDLEPALQPLAEPAAEAEDELPLWPDDWRERMALETAGSDQRAFAKELKRLQRYASPPKVWAKAAELEAKLSAGSGVRIPGPQASVAERAAFNRALGVPETVEDYFDQLTLAKSRVLGDADRPTLEFFAGRLHPQGATPAMISALADAWFDYQHAMASAREETDDTFRRRAERELRREWGGGYAATTRAIATMLDRAPHGVRAIFAGGRTPDGRKTGDDPTMLRWLAALALELYPAGQHYGDDGGATASDRLAEIRKIRQEQPDLYEGDHALQAEELDLIETEMRGRRRR